MVISGTHSGGGKTTVTAIVLRGLRAVGLTVQPFKIGPDFIDPGYHTEVTGRPSINLDLWMMGEEGVRRSYRRWSRDADVCVVEAMGALYDGADGTEHGSAAHVAKLLDVPVVVVLDVWGMTRTAGAVLSGLRAFDPDVAIVGCVLNRVGSPAHARMVVDGLAESLRPLVLGAVERRPELEIPERHLGLLTVEENPTRRASREEAQRRAAEGLNLDRLLRAAARGGPSPTESDPGPSPARRTAPVARIAIARDQAYSFYYEENLVALRDAGFELVPFRPTVDRGLPEGVDAVYLGGGYPESFAAELEANEALAAQLCARADAGMPVYAECGGLMYLARSLTGYDGVRRRMSGVLPLDIAMDPDHLAIRYVEARTRMASPLGAAGSVVRGQEFHQSRLVDADVEPLLYDVTTSDGDAFRAGYLHRNVVASYLHLHFASRPEVPGSLLRAAVEARAV